MKGHRLIASHGQLACLSSASHARSKRCTFRAVMGLHKRSWEICGTVEPTKAARQSDAVPSRCVRVRPSRVFHVGGGGAAATCHSSSHGPGWSAWERPPLARPNERACGALHLRRLTRPSRRYCPRRPSLTDHGPDETDQFLMPWTHAGLLTHGQRSCSSRMNTPRSPISTH